MNDSALDPARLDGSARLEALRASGLLRHDLKGRLDLLCETAAEILRVPFSQVNILDDRVQMSVGKWPPDDDRITEVAHSACKEVVVAGQPIVVPDMLVHPVLCMIPFVQETGGRAYLGVPIYFDGQVLGSFCVADQVVRRWTAWDVAGLQGLARLAGLAVSA